MPATVCHAAVELTAQAEEYLEAICRILERGSSPTPTELAHELSIAPPSVLGMLRRMEDQQLLTYTRKTGVILTDKGQAFADRLRRRHRLAERLLTDLLDMPWERAHEVACRFEHVIDDEVEEYLVNALHHPDTCPHGNPLHAPPPSAPGRMRTLDSCAPGESGILRRVTNESTVMLDYLSALALLPGARVTIVNAAPMGGPFTIDVDGHRHALARDMAACLLLETPEETR